MHDRFIDGAPLSAVEVLPAPDTLEDVHEKIREYLDAATPLVWIVDLFDFTVTVYRLGEEPVLFTRQQELSDERVLPGFRVRVGTLFM